MNIDQVGSFETKEKGASVEIAIRFMRHGERDKDGNLLDLGREITKERAAEDVVNTEHDFDAVKAIGSDAGPKGPTGMQRSLETADIYAQEMAGDEAYATRVNSLLSYEGIKSPVPYNHVEIYNQNLPENFTSLKGDEYVAAAKKAQDAVMNHLFSLDTPEAKAYMQEVAGAFATVVEHYIDVAQRINSESKVLIPAGTHGGSMELLLMEALVSVGPDGTKKMGFKNADEIGGGFSPSESYTVDIKTDEKGGLLPLNVSFASSTRPHGELYLDIDKVRELSAYYAQLHAENES